MLFELKDLPRLVGIGAKAAHRIIRTDEDETFEEWLFRLQTKDGWDGFNEFASLAARALAADRTSLQDELAIRVMQAANFGFVACASDALTTTTEFEDLLG
jgi:hypothetical protein